MSLTLTPVGIPGGSIRKTVADTVIDRIQVTLRWEEQAPSGSDNIPFDLELTQDRAVEAVNFFIEHIRIAAHAAWVPRVRRAWRPQDGQYYLLTPWTISAFDANTGAPIPVFAGVNGMASPGALRAPETGSIPIAMIEDSLRLGNASLPIAMLLDAEEAVEALTLREAILAIASACEVAAKTYISRNTGSQTASFEKGLQGSFASKFYDQAPSHFSQRSFKQEDPSGFALIEEMYRERNRLIHTGSMTRRLLDVTSRERQRTVYAYLSAGNRAVDWITILTK
ncbi:hypothetical protein [Streptomyces monashensis]|uniref:hypothetical protein n=1 Tax=Streptomyces monashensis TaxID=1678012 RepID=UPI001160A662|nr:hypothetical protein [Streptomyces monashensis]